MNKFTPESKFASRWPPSSPADRHHTHSDDLMVQAQPDKAWRHGHIKWYDPQRRFGFVVCGDSGADVFLHWRCLSKSRVRPIDLREESRVKFLSRAPTQEGHYRDEVVELVLL